MNFNKIRKRYWRQVILDYISCLACDTDYQTITKEEEDEVIDRLMNDSEMWSAIDESVEYHLQKVFYKRNNTDKLIIKEEM
jgi:hypothetical protein